jgi:hypothetical protein
MLSRIPASMVTALHLKEEQYTYMHLLLAQKLVIVTELPILPLSATISIVKIMAHVSILHSRTKVSVNNDTWINLAQSVQSISIH